MTLTLELPAEVEIEHRHAAHGNGELQFSPRTAGSDLMEIRDSDFEEIVLQSDRPVLVHFWAAWDQSSRMMQSVVDRLAMTVEDWADVYVVNVDRCSALAVQFEVCGVPTFVAFADGQAVCRKTGAMTEAQMVQLLKTAEQAMSRTSEPETDDDEGCVERAA